MYLIFPIWLMLILLSTDLYFLGKLHLLPVGAYPNTARGQTDGESSAVNLEGQTALFVIVGLLCTDWYALLHTVPASFLSAVLCVWISTVLLASSK